MSIRGLLVDPIPNSPNWNHKNCKPDSKERVNVTCFNISYQGPLAHECSAQEVRGLIRALFQNTDRRAAVLAKLKPVQT